MQIQILIEDKQTPEGSGITLQIATDTPFNPTDPAPAQKSLAFHIATVLSQVAAGMMTASAWDKTGQDLTEPKNRLSQGSEPPNQN